MFSYNSPAGINFENLLNRLSQWQKMKKFILVSVWNETFALFVSRRLPKNLEGVNSRTVYFAR
jgi:hypothetical protein